MGANSSILPPAGLRRRVAEAVHRGVCLATGSDGMGHCAVYAAAAVKVLARLTGARYIVQGGTLSVRLSRAYREAHPGGLTHFTMEARASHRGGTCGAVGEHLEFHAWAARAHGRTDEVRLNELVDLSARHYRRWAGALDPAWPGPEDFQQDFVWTTGDLMPEGVCLIPDPQTTLAVMGQLGGAVLRHLVGEAARHALSDLERDRPQKVGRNEPCVCGSGRKFKKCCLDGALKVA